MASKTIYINNKSVRTSISIRIEFISLWMVLKDSSFEDFRDFILDSYDEFTLDHDDKGAKGMSDYIIDKIFSEILDDESFLEFMESKEMLSAT